VTNLIDIGYNEGEFSKEFKKLNKKIKIIGFEPNKSLINNKVDEIFNYAISDTNAKSKYFFIHNDRSHSGVSSLSKRTEFNPSFNKNFKKTKVEVITLDFFYKKNNLIKNGKYFIKIDVEGYESNCIYGAKLFFKELMPVGIFEYSNGWIESKNKLKNLFYHLDNINYSLYRITPLGLELIRFFHESLETYQYSNYFFCPKNYLEKEKLYKIEISNDFSKTDFFPFNKP
jgi:FkbM family methyltransferase